MHRKWGLPWVGSKHTLCQCNAIIITLSLCPTGYSNEKIQPGMKMIASLGPTFFQYPDIFQTSASSSSSWPSERSSECVLCVFDPMVQHVKKTLFFHLPAWWLMVMDSLNEACYIGLIRLSSILLMNHWSLTCLNLDWIRDESPPLTDGGFTCSSSPLFQKGSDSDQNEYTFHELLKGRANNQVFRQSDWLSPDLPCIEYPYGKRWWFHDCKTHSDTRFPDSWLSGHLITLPGMILLSFTTRNGLLEFPPFPACRKKQ